MNEGEIDGADSSLTRLGWSAARKAELEALGDATLVPARVVVEHRGAYGLAGCAIASARPAGPLRDAGARWPTVGDWVAVTASPSGVGLIQHVLARTSLLERKRPRVARPQAIAANVDVVFVVTTAEQPPNLRRIERTLAVVAASGARAVIVLNKIDLARDADGDLRALASVSAGAPCLATSAATRDGIEALRGLLPPGTTTALIGPSGSGKSSLINALLGGERQATGAVRVSDAKGRHTTTRRELLELPGGACLIDTPGMRELGLWEAGEGIDKAFAELTELAASCRFRDCQHQGEPGCAVAAALKSGALDADRFASFEKLRREDAFVERQQDPRNAAATKGRWKTIHKQLRARKGVDPKLRDD
jgi:ribosome biogenesis GTPase / thiamine phosphate phosphatase